MEQVVSEFLAETRKGLSRLNAELISLKQNPTDRDTLVSMFRTLHTIKGTCDFLGFMQLGKLAQAAGNLLIALRDGKVAFSANIHQALAAAVEAVGELIDYIECAGLDGLDFSDLVVHLDDLCAGRSVEQTEIKAPLEAEQSHQESDIETAPETEQNTAEIVDQTAPEAEQSDNEAVAFDEEMVEVLKDFLEESNEGLDRLDSELVELEQSPDNRDILASIFRTIHTIKGTCGFLGFNRLEKVAHVGENLLALLRDGKLALTEEIINALLAMVDAVRTMLGEIERSSNDGQEEYGDLIATLTRLKDGETAPQAAATPVTSEITNPPEPTTSTTPATATQPMSNSVATPVQDSVKKAAAATGSPTSAPKKAQHEKQTGSSNVVESSIRVDIPLLDRLMNLVGELVLARNQIVEHANVDENAQFLAISQRLNLITSELQEGVMQTRMQPINNIWAKFPRVVRDLAIGCGKKVRVEMEGKETELDKSLIEAMKDPLTHLIRNSVDHGVEMPEARRAAGKPEEGRLLLRAYHEGGQVHIEIHDDGAGINTDKICNKAVEKGLISREQADQMNPQEAAKLIFLAGLSTAEKVTNISGRGVGMDVVKTNIEKISGAIDLESEPGRGSIFKIRVPLTLAIVPALIVTSGGERFAIPQVNLLELIRIDQAQQNICIEYIHGTPVYRLRGKLLPIVYLNRELGLNNADATGTNMVVLQAEQRQFGLVVDQVNDSQEIVVKPLAEALKDISVFAGATIMGDGRVALILDILGIAQRARVLSKDRKHSAGNERQTQHNRDSKRQTILIVRSPGNGRLAIPLNRVARLEEFSPNQVENSGDVDVIQYRGGILPLIPMGDVLEERRSHQRLALDENNVKGSDCLHVVVFGNDGQNVGLVVEEVLDIVEETIAIKGRANRCGIVGTAVIQDRVTELFDVEGFLKQAMAQLMDNVEMEV